MILVKWQLRRAVLQRDNFECQNCGKKGPLEVHHFKPVKRGGTDDLDNLISVCRSCHKIIELKPIKPRPRKRQGWSTIAISRRNHERLKAFGRLGETFDNALSRVLDIAEKCTKFHKYQN